ncbi:2-(3-amino-3-carboxypropyl)histidine synthase [Candidatus Burarchaeum australiense]|nr:2-(3-amino-3-carboxypropyl)histidine synthase [Candidatus Burarchaeum australiense]
MRLLLQFPEGLKKLALEKAREYEAQGHEVFISSAQCFGACDLAFEEARAVKADKIVHFGHAEFLGAKAAMPIPVEYVEFPIDVSLAPVMRKAIAALNAKKCGKVGLVTTVQHVQQLPSLRSMLEKAGKTVVVGRGTRTKYEGQILGCDTIAAASIAKDVDCILYFGGGLFHPLGVGSEGGSGKPVLVADPFANSVKWLDAKDEEKRKKGLLTRAILAKTFGILVSTKTGQFSLEAARAAKKRLEAKGKRAEILVSNFVDFEALENFQSFDAYINTACPRLRDDYERARKPVLNLADVEELLKLLQ